MRFLLVGLLLFASTALGQVTLTLTVDNTTDTTKVIGLNREDCGTALDLDWTFTGAACAPLQLWVTASTCRNEPAPGDLVLPEVPRDRVSNQGTLQRSIPVNQLPIFASGDAGAVTCATAELDQTVRVCGATLVLNTLNNNCETVFKNTPVQVRFDTQKPPKPTLDAVTPRDSALGITVTAEKDSTVIVTASLQEADGGVGAVVSRDETTATEGTAELRGLQNGVTYLVIAQATDVSGNFSLSDPSTGTPVKTNGFYDAYVRAGGEETGGCGATGGGIAAGAVVAALGFWLARRKLS
jgi:uncharacterized protein (TIGR03382 family)